MATKMTERQVAFQLEYRGIWINWLKERHADLLTRFPEYSGEVIARLASRMFFQRTHAISLFSRVLNEGEDPSARMAKYQEYLRAYRDKELTHDLGKLVDEDKGVLLNAITALKRKHFP